MGGETALPPGAPCGRAAGKPPRVRGPPRPARGHTRAAARACQGLGCAAAMLPAGSPQPRNRSLGPWGPGARDRTVPAGVSPGRPGPSSQPTLSKLLGLGETLRLCSSAAASGTLGSLALADNVPEPASFGYPQTYSLWGRHPGGGGVGISSAAKQRRQATPASGVPSPRVPQPSCAHSRAHTHTHTLGAPLSRPAAGARWS